MQLTPGDQAMTTRRATAPNEKALESFLATKRRIDDMLAVRIADDGHGRAGIDGTGTGSMRERVRLVGGTFRRDASPGVGTTVAIEVPFAVSGGTEWGPPTRPIPTISMFPPPAWGETDD